MVMAVVVAVVKAVADATLHAHALFVPNPFPLLLVNAAAAGAAGRRFPDGWLWSHGQGTGALAASIIYHTLN